MEIFLGKVFRNMKLSIFVTSLVRGDFVSDFFVEINEAPKPIPMVNQIFKLKIFKLRK